MVEDKIEFLIWLFKLAREEYCNDVNLCLLELNAQGFLPKWYMLN